MERLLESITNKPLAIVLAGMYGLIMWLLVDVRVALGRYEDRFETLEQTIESIAEKEAQNHKLSNAADKRTMILEYRVDEIEKKIEIN